MFYALIAKAIEKKPNLSFEDDQTAKNGENRANFDDDRAIMLTYHDPEKKTYQRVLEIWPKKASSYVIVKKRLYEYLLGLKTPDFGKYFTKDLILARLTKKYKKPWVNLNDDQLKSFLADFIAQYWYGRATPDPCHATGGGIILGLCLILYLTQPDFTLINLGHWFYTGPNH